MKKRNPIYMLDGTHLTVTNKRHIAELIKQKGSEISDEPKGWTVNRTGYKIQLIDTDTYYIVIYSTDRRQSDFVVSTKKQATEKTLKYIENKNKKEKAAMDKFLKSDQYKNLVDSIQVIDITEELKK